MANSYIRPCRSCARRISMRQMPHGKWVAFENGEAHHCSEPPMVEVVRPGPRQTRQVDAPTEFDDIVIPDQQPPQPTPVLRRPVEPPPSQPILPTPQPATPSPNPALSSPPRQPTTNLQNGVSNRPRAEPSAPQVIEPIPNYPLPVSSLGWLSGGIKSIATVYIILGVLHSIAFSLIVSRATCATTTQSLVYIFCNTGMGVSHFVTLVGWPWYWL
jgi:hypothetical protein